MEVHLYTECIQNISRTQVFYEACNIVVGGAIGKKDALFTRGICNLTGLFK